MIGTGDPDIAEVDEVFEQAGEDAALRRASHQVRMEREAGQRPFVAQDINRLLPGGEGVVWREVIVPEERVIIEEKRRREMDEWRTCRVRLHHFGQIAPLEIHLILEAEGLQQG